MENKAQSYTWSVRCGGKKRLSENPVYLPLRVRVLSSVLPFNWSSSLDALRLDRSVTEIGTCRKMLMLARTADFLYS